MNRFCLVLFLTAAVLPGLSGIVDIMLVDFIMLSDVHCIIAADAGEMARGTTRADSMAAATNIFM